MNPGLDIYPGTHTVHTHTHTPHTQDVTHTRLIGVGTHGTILAERHSHLGIDVDTQDYTDYTA